MGLKRPLVKSPARGCWLWSNANPAVTLTTGVITAIPFDSEIWDSDSFHSTVTNTTRIVIPSGLGGKYRFSGTADFGGASTAGRRDLTISKNGSTYGYLGYGISAAQGEVILNGSVQALAVPGDYFELNGQQTSGGNLVIGGTASYLTSFTCEYLGA